MVLRQDKGEPLTHEELDSNFAELGTGVGQLNNNISQIDSNITQLASDVSNIPIVVHKGTTVPDNSMGNNGDTYFKEKLPDEMLDVVGSDEIAPLNDDGRYIYASQIIVDTFGVPQTMGTNTGNTIGYFFIEKDGDEARVGFCLNNFSDNIDGNVIRFNDGNVKEFTITEDFIYFEEANGDMPQYYFFGYEGYGDDDHAIPILDNLVDYIYNKCSNDLPFDIDITHRTTIKHEYAEYTKINGEWSQINNIMSTPLNENEKIVTNMVVCSQDYYDSITPEQGKIYYIEKE